MNICKIEKGFYVSHREADQYATWSTDEVRIDPPENMVDGKFYRFNGDGTWTECDAGPARTRDEIQAEIDMLEREDLAGRFVRESLLVVGADMAERMAEKMTAAGQPTTKEQVLAANAGYQKALARNTQLTALRTQMAGLA